MPDGWLKNAVAIHGIRRAPISIVLFLIGQLMSPSQIAQSPRNAEGSTLAASPWAGYTDKPDGMPLGGYATFAGCVRRNVTYS